MGPVVVVGAGQAGLQVALSFRECGFESGITLVGDELGLPYWSSPPSPPHPRRRPDARPAEAASPASPSSGSSRTTP